MSQAKLNRLILDEVVIASADVRCPVEVIQLCKAVNPGQIDVSPWTMGKRDV
jgi:hypothetical protein